jgi:hypothetical protein
MEAQILEIQELGLENFLAAASVEAMVPVMVVPIVVVIVADPARTVIGPDHPAAVVRVIRRVVVIRRVEVPVKAMVPKREPAVAEAATVENMSGAKPAAVKRRTSTMEAAAAVKTAATMASPTAMTTAAMTTAAMASTTMTAADFGRQPVGGMCRCRRRGRTDQRQRFCALVGCERQHQHGGRRQAQRTDKGARTGADQPASGIWYFHHA